ncbi:MAG: hypothetical protein ACR2G2_11140 [Pseudonocardia sp.]
MTDTSPSMTRRTVLWAIATGGALAASTAVVACGTNPSSSGTGTGTTTPSGDPAPGTLVMVIRHGEKPGSASSLPGHDENGNPDDSSLTEIGWNRARKLADVFDPGQGPSRPGLASPKAIYAAGANDNGEGARTRETVKPLADRLGIAVNTKFGKGDEESLVKAVSAQPGPTLISWQHGEIPAIAEAFGSVTPTPPQDWPDDRFDMVWTFTATANGWRFAQVPELALPGDKASVIKN